MLERIKSYFHKMTGVTVIWNCDESSPEDYIQDPFSNPSFMLAMQKRTEATKMIKLGIYTGEGDKKVEQKKHKLVSLLEKVNPNLSYGDFIDYVLNWSIGRNNGCLLEKRTGLSSYAPDIILYNPDNFTVSYDSYGISKIEINTPHQIITGEELKNFIWLKSANYYQEVAGYSPNKTAVGLTNQNAMSVVGSYIKKVWLWNLALAKNNGRPGGIISSKDGYNLSKEDREEIRDEYTAMMSGSNNGKPIVLGGNATYLDTSKTPIDVDWSNGELTSHKRICLSVGVPPELVGSGESTYNNRKEAKKELYTDTIIPWYEDFIRQLNHFLEKELNGAYFDLKVGEIEALKEDKGEELKALETAKDRLTVNEYRKEYARITGVDLKDIPNGDQIIIGVDTLENISTPIQGDGNEKEDDI